jgi:uncharacterized protein YndB with AHSA1/START domain
MTRSIRIVQRVEAPLDLVWNACADARGLARWQADEVEGDVAPDSTLVMRWPDLRAELRVRVVELAEGRAVAFQAGDSLVRLELEPGSLSLTHSGLGSEDEARGSTSSWRAALAILAHGLARHPERDRRVHRRLQRARTRAETAHVFFTDRAALGAWLTRDGRVGATGETVALRLADGATLTGRVLSNEPGRDVALSWSEDDDSVLTLRTLPGVEGGERLIALGWSRWTERSAPDARLTQFEAALERLARMLETSPSA